MNIFNVVLMLGLIVVVMLTTFWGTLRVMEAISRLIRRRRWRAAHNPPWDVTQVTDNGDGTTTVHVNLHDIDADTHARFFEPLDPRTLDRLAPEPKDNDDDR